jgi:hypothetical protein
VAKYYDAIIALRQGITYYTPKDAVLKVERVGTNSTGPAYLWIRETQLGRINSLVAPLHRTGPNLLGPLDLGDKYYIVPRETSFKFTGDPGSIMVVKGKWIMLDKPDEVVTELAARGITQFNEYKTYIESTVSLGTDVMLRPDEEIILLRLAPTEIETYTLNGPLMVSVSNYEVSEGELALRFFLDNSYLTNLTDLPGQDRKGGIDIKYCPRPPTDMTEMDVFSLAGSPVTLKGPHTLQILVRNIKGDTIAPREGTALTFTITAIVDYSSVPVGR